MLEPAGSEEELAAIERELDYLAIVAHQAEPTFVFWSSVERAALALMVRCQRVLVVIQAEVLDALRRRTQRGFFILRERMVATRLVQTRVRGLLENARLELRGVGKITAYAS